MKILLRSTILVQHSDNPDLFYKNQQTLYKSRMGFEIKEDQAIWEFVSEFANTESHVPNFKTVRDHFAQLSEVQIVDRLQVISGVIPIMRGDFHIRLTDKARERQVRRVEQLIVDASEIVRRGKEIHDGKKKVKIKGPVAALRHIVEQSHDIIAPSLGLKLSGEATTDGKDLWDEYQMVKNDPRAGLGQYTGLKEMDKLRGVKRKQLWTHAAFTGQLKSILALNWAYNQAVYYYYSSLYMSLEMPYDQCRRILYAMHSIHGKFRDIRMKLGIQEHPGISVGCQYERIRDGLLTDAQEEFLENYVIPDFGDKDNNPYGQIHIHTADFDKSTFTVDDLRMKSEMQFSQDPFDTIFIDHAGLMTSREKYGTTTERLNEVMRDLKRYALNFNQGLGMATVALFQLSREGVKRLHKAREKGNEPLYSLYDLSYANECCVEGTLIPTGRGLLPIEQVRVGDQVWSLSGPKPVLSVFDQGVQPVWEIITDRGTRIEVTAGHRVRVCTGPKETQWRKVSDLQEGDELRVTCSSDLPFPDTPVAEEYRQRFNPPGSGLVRVAIVQPLREVARMYDLEVPGDHEYLTGPLLSHNCERSSDVVSAGYVDKELLDQNLVQIQCLKACDDEPFETFRARVNFPYRRIVNWNEIPTAHDTEEDEDFADLLNDL